WHRNYLTSVYRYVLGVASPGKESTHPVAHTPVRHTVASNRNCPCYFQTGDLRRSFWNVIAADSLQEIGIVYSGGLDLDQNFSGTWLGHIMAHHMDIGGFGLGSFFCSGPWNEADCLHLRG